MFGLSELALVLLVFAVVLGIRKLPELTRAAGKAARIFKSEARALKTQDAAPEPFDGNAVEGKIVGRGDGPRP
ncbi:twin-arginine translocase TatA/TatE family subunit [Streptomyces sp. LaPpAH-108]|uniref:twin-arginine translocase TatA/TatE family subunit n=1 Tax=Streptomyces sp. LaPpAH-108 TaxID=1155714 RepID=UPI00036D42BB|nr:twin-arginine translocase TatA/TatE family subunit [Streptomyces sp. LaPpAH-108]